MEDRIFIGKKSVIVLDGATQADQTIEQTGGWIADQIGQRFSNLIEGNDDEVELTELLAQAIADTRDEFNLVPGKSPSTTVSAARFAKQGTDLLVLGDSPATSCSFDGASLTVLKDGRLAIAASTLAKPLIPQDSGTGWNSYYKSLASFRNRPGGFWVAEADPTAAMNAITLTTLRNGPIVLCTDGVSSIVNQYKAMSWRELFEAARRPKKLIEEVQLVESNDLLRVRYPRSKVSDDKLVVFASP